MKQVILCIGLAAILAIAGCTKEPPVTTKANIPPKTFLWLFPDSTIAEGQSRQHIRWWGEDPDGVVKGFIVVGAKFSGGISPGSVLDTIGWRWKTGNDSIVPFPLLTKRDTFAVAVRAVDNTFGVTLPDQAMIRFAPATGTTSAPFWDANENGVFDAGDRLLTTLDGALDPKGATLGIPLLNQPPSIVFAQNPNDPTVVMAQPETTYTAATFAWIGSDPDGDQTIAGYEIALNDTVTPANIVTVPANITIVSLVVPRSRTDNLTGVQAVNADLWSGTFSTTRRNIGTIPNLRLDTLNAFYVRARDIAGDVSPFIRMPGTPTGRWFVKRPKGKLLIISDYIGSDKLKAIKFYRDSVFTTLGFPNAELIDIGFGLTADQKRNSKLGRFVPPFLDPAFIYTLGLYDLVYWFTDQFPSLAVAQYPLYQYVRDPSHRGKVIFSTMFEAASDPRGALSDFAPIDSVSSVFLSNASAMPTLGTTLMPIGYQVLPDSSDPSDIFPTLEVAPLSPLPGQFFVSLYMRPIYRRADAKYIYQMQPDNGYPQRYTMLATLNDLQSVVPAGGAILACGANGTILRSSDGGESWKTVASTATTRLEALRMIDANNVWAVGDVGTILHTTDGGLTWANLSVVTDQNLLDITAAGSQLFIAGTSGLFIRSSNNGATWSAINLPTTLPLRAVRFTDASTGIVTGSGGFIAKTTNGGSSWRQILSLTSADLYGLQYATSSLVLATGTNSTILRSTNGGESWSTSTVPGGDVNSTLKSVLFTDALNGIAVGADLSGSPPPPSKIWQTADGGQTWSTWESTHGQTLPLASQVLNAICTPDQQNFWICGNGGLIIHSGDGGNSWSFQPRGKINVGVIDGVGTDGKRSFLFLGLPLHFLDGSGPTGDKVVPFLQHVIQQEFGF